MMMLIMTMMMTTMMMMMILMMTILITRFGKRAALLTDREPAVLRIEDVRLSRLWLRCFCFLKLKWMLRNKINVLNYELVNWLINNYIKPQSYLGWRRGVFIGAELISKPTRLRTTMSTFQSFVSLSMMMIYHGSTMLIKFFYTYSSIQSYASSQCMQTLCSVLTSDI